MLEVRMKPPPPTPPHIAALSYFWGHWGSEDPSLKTTNPSFLTLCVCTLPPFPGPALPPRRGNHQPEKQRPEYFPRAPVTLPLFSPTLGGRGRAGPAGTEGADARRKCKTHPFYLSCRGWFPSQLSHQGWGHASSTW